MARTARNATKGLDFHCLRQLLSGLQPGHSRSAGRSDSCTETPVVRCAPREHHQRPRESSSCASCNTNRSSTPRRQQRMANGWAMRRLNKHNASQQHPRSPTSAVQGPPRRPARRARVEQTHPPGRAATPSRCSACTAYKSATQARRVDGVRADSKHRPPMGARVGLMHPQACG
jgi:hypothetical protein